MPKSEPISSDVQHRVLKFRDILIGPAYYEYGFLKVNVSWHIIDHNSDSPVAVMLKWYPEVCLDQPRAPSYAQLVGKGSASNGRKSTVSSAIAFGSSYVITGLQFMCRYSISLEAKLNEALSSNTRHGHRKPSATPVQISSQQIIKHFETPTCGDARVVGDVEPPCFFPSPSNSLRSDSSSRVAADAEILSFVRPAPPRNFNCHVTVPALQPSPISATCWWRQPRSVTHDNAVDSAPPFDGNGEQNAVTQVTGYRLFHTLIEHANDLELVRLGRRKKKRDAPVYMKLLTKVGIEFWHRFPHANFFLQDELSFTLANLKSGKTYIVELQTVIQPSSNSLPTSSISSAPVRQLIHVPIVDTESKTARKFESFLKEIDYRTSYNYQPSSAPAGRRINSFLVAFSSIVCSIISISLAYRVL